MTNERIPPRVAFMDKEEIVDVLNELLEVTRTGRVGFAQTMPALTEILHNRSRACAKAEVELVAMIRTYGFEPTRRGAAATAQDPDLLHLTARAGADREASVLEACQLGEEVAMARYRQALNEQLPEKVRDLLLQQLDNLKHNHDKILARLVQVHVHGADARGSAV